MRTLYVPFANTPFQLDGQFYHFNAYNQCFLTYQKNHGLSAFAIDDQH